MKRTPYARIEFDSNNEKMHIDLCKSSRKVSFNYKMRTDKRFLFGSAISQCEYVREMVDSGWKFNLHTKNQISQEMLDYGWSKIKIVSVILLKN